ncbi:MmcQ/YjbR family DNA-binding protein [Balneola sp. MJW-20]|uniref:MmcQ/YjbR family DNA-binding protein n=1 Tax=Gracilimonas aurantiaca TaxID=3234185 RepID=UPI0034660BCD
MDIQTFYEFCMSLPGTSDGFPFDEDTLVLKVMGKIFAITNVEKFNGINLKCDPVKAIEYRAEYEEVQPGYHTNKKHWNFVDPRGSLDDELLFNMIEDSYNLVAATLPKKLKEELDALSG